MNEKNQINVIENETKRKGFRGILDFFNRLGSLKKEKDFHPEKPNQPIIVPREITPYDLRFE